jgi:hypothetical protein
MSIDAAAKELTKEIERLLKEAARLTKLRDSLVPDSTSTESLSAGPSARKKATKKSTRKARKTVSAKTVATPNDVAPKKRTLSAAGKKRISDAAKQRWAAKRKAEAAAK